MAPSPTLILKAITTLSIVAGLASAVSETRLHRERRLQSSGPVRQHTSLKRATASCDPSAFISLLPAGSSVNLTQTVAENGTFSDPTTNGGQPATVSSLPPLCVAKFTVPTSPSSEVDVALFLPDTWNERFMATGNGGFGGFINWADMASFSHYGFATMSTNTGHYSRTFDAGWALNQPEKQIDWGYRAMHTSVDLSKQIIRAYYGADTQYNYYSGCSTGGRQGLKELTVYPDDFDGIIAGAPAWWTTHLQPWSIQIGLANLLGPQSSHISNDLFVTIVSEVVRQCDPQDGVTDGIVSDPYGCHFIPEVLLCNGTVNPNSTSCLTSEQLGTLYHVLNDWVDVNQTFVFPRLALGADPSALAGVTTQPSSIGLTYVDNFLLNDTAYDWRDSDYGIVQLADQLDPGQANASYHVEAFRAKGGKLLHYHGLADQLISTGSSVYYHSQVQQSLASQGLSMDGWYRMFLIPGMQHCTGTAQGAPWYVAAANQQIGGASYSVPGFMDGKHDLTLAIMDWVEKGVAPDAIIGTKWNDDDVADGVEIQRPICPYPQQAVYAGNGDVRAPESWNCQSSYAA